MLSDDLVGERPDPFFRPAREDAPDEAERPYSRCRAVPSDDHPPGKPPPCSPRSPSPRTRSPASMPAPKPPPAPLRDGLIARLAFREAAGCLAAEYAWVHPHDLALRELRLTGGFDAALLAPLGGWSADAFDPDRFVGLAGHGHAGTAAKCYDAMLA